MVATKKYTMEHEWIEVDGNGVGTVGITDYAQKALGDVVFVEVPAVGTKVEKKSIPTLCVIWIVSDGYFVMFNVMLNEWW